IAVENYNQAIKLNPNEYRAYWFMATHYSQMGNSVQAMENMYKAQNLLPKKEPADFWNEFTCAAVFANMPSHAIFAMKKETKILGHKGNAEEQLGKSIYEKIESVDKYKSYKNTEIWNAEDVGNLAQFISRPLGIKLLVDTICKLSIYDYKNNSAAFMIASPLIKKNNKEIGYTIAILMKTAEEKDKLEDYLNNFIKPYNNKKKVIFSTKYENIIAYEIKESSMYKDNGGGHLYMIGIERNEPEISGLLLETPELLQNKTDEIQYYRASSRKDRFKGKIFYAIMLDTCEDIFEVSYRDFKNFFDNLVIE
ncbi:MAG: hypothetical protein LBN95_00910, partial [Prevotellaceae bacterium]|nr:hypothetical protein [Prevotellaceae bacterium]